MKSLIAMGLAMLIISLAPIEQASAGELLTDDCIVAAADTDLPIVFLADFKSSSGLSCVALQNIEGKVQWAQLVIAPAIVVLERTAIGKAILVRLAAEGISDPAVVTVTVIGALGAKMFNIVLKKSLADCKAEDKEQLKRELIQDLKGDYGLRCENAVLEFSK